MSRNIKEIVRQIPVEEKAGFCSGIDNLHLYSLPRLNIPDIMVADGPHGLRKQAARCSACRWEVNSTDAASIQNYLKKCTITR